MEIKNFYDMIFCAIITAYCSQAYGLTDYLSFIKEDILWILSPETAKSRLLQLQ